jgi:acetyltransferase
MTIRNLDHLFKPRSLAVIGASHRPRSVGAAVLHNVVNGGFSGRIMLVDPHHRELSELPVYADVPALPQAPDLAVICTPPEAIPRLITALGERGTKAAIVITAGLAIRPETHKSDLNAEMLAAAKPHLLRILGPNCMGLLVPAIGLNASFAPLPALQGRIAFVSQSGALVSAVLDWARSRSIGFSKFISLGEASDIDFGDLLDYLGSDAETDSVLLYVESVTAARKFMSAARAAARNKPVLIVKAGRVGAGAPAAASLTGAMAGSDAVYDAAIRRAGMLRVFSTEELFEAVEALARMRSLPGERLVVMTNGGGPEVMAADALGMNGGALATLSESTLNELDSLLPANWSRANPVDVIGDAPPERYARAMDVLLREPQADALLLIHAPMAIVPSAEIARELLPAASATGRNVLSCWLGGDGVREARALFSHAGLPTYDTPEDAVAAFGQMVRYRRNQQLLTEVPSASASDFGYDHSAARTIVNRALGEGRSMLSDPEAKAVLAAYGVPVVATRTAASAAEAADAAKELGFPVALKVLSRDVTHKSEIGGVILDLPDARAVIAAASTIEQHVRERRPDAAMEGFTVQTMVHRVDAHELIVGMASDPTFGPILLFGHGGTSTEVAGDRAIGLPPLNAVLARDLVRQTRVARLLAGDRGRLPVDMEAIVRTLVQVSDLVADLPAVAELDINPLLADATGVIALDARIRVTAQHTSGIDRFAIRPYPKELQQSLVWEGRSILLRPIRPEDAEQHRAFFNALDVEDIHFRTFMQLRSLELSQLARLTQIDYDREMAFIATAEGDAGHRETLGVARAVSDPDNVTAEMAIIVRSDVKGHGLGRILLGKLLTYCRSRGTREVVGEVLIDNHRMIALARAFCFQILPSEAPGTFKLRLELQSESVPA